MTLTYNDVRNKKQALEALLYTWLNFHVPFDMVDKMADEIRTEMLVAKIQTM